MDCFIKKIFIGNIDNSVHKNFVRFGKGIYGKKAVLGLQKNSKIKLKGSFEYANDFVSLASEFQARFSGIILSREKLNLEGEKKKSLFVYEVSDLEGEKIKEIENKVYFMLLDGNADGLTLKIKKKIPKPKKTNEAKVDDKFCQLEADMKYWQKIRETFFWDVSECKRARIEHEYKISELIMPSDEKDFELLRLKTRRKGILIRKLEVDGKSLVKEKEFVA